MESPTCSWRWNLNHSREKVIALSPKCVDEKVLKRGNKSSSVNLSLETSVSQSLPMSLTHYSQEKNESDKHTKMTEGNKVQVLVYTTQICFFTIHLIVPYEEHLNTVKIQWTMIIWLLQTLLFPLLFFSLSCEDNCVVSDFWENVVLNSNRTCLFQCWELVKSEPDYPLPICCSGPFPASAPVMSQTNGQLLGNSAVTVH
jgi:hypothetical protein